MRFTRKELNKILKDHEKWLNDKNDGKRANLKYSNLIGANFRGANLKWVNFRRADLAGANFKFANLTGANLIGADLEGANLIGADLTGANFTNAKINLPIACPEKGSFIAYKKARGYIVKLEIPEDAKRSSATTKKCRCNKAKVLSIENRDGTKADIGDTVASSHDINFIYKVGEIVKVDNFDENRWNECAPGIHFFMDRQDAVSYY